MYTWYSRLQCECTANWNAGHVCKHQSKSIVAEPGCLVADFKAVLVPCILSIPVQKSKIAANLRNDTTILPTLSAIV